MIHSAVLIPGDGIGPEIAQVAQQAIQATGVHPVAGGPGGAAQIPLCGSPCPRKPSR